MRVFGNLIFIAVLSAVVFGQRPQPTPPQVVAGIPVNYDEALVGNYTLPDLFTCADGKKVTDAKTWTNKRRPELLKTFEEIQFGKMPPAPKSMRFDVFDK